MYRNMNFSDLSKLLYAMIYGSFLSFSNLAHAEVERDCKTSLSALSWAVEDDRHHYALRTEVAGGALHGLRCGEEEIIAWFEENSWTFLRSGPGDGSWAGYGARRYRTDRYLVFCRPQPFLLGWLKGGCRDRASVTMFEGRITQIFSGPTK